MSPDSLENFGGFFEQNKLIAWKNTDKTFLVFGFYKAFSGIT